MKSYKELVREKLINERVEYSHIYIARFYKDQLKKFNKIGLGKKTDNGVTVTDKLIEITKTRLYQLQPMAAINKEEE